MDRERAEAHLRLVAEAALRSGDSARVTRVARALTAVGALDGEDAARILDELELARSARQGGAAIQYSFRPGRVPRAPGPARVPGRRAPAGVVVPAGRPIPVRAEGVSGEVYLLSYAQPACRGLLTMVARADSRSGPAEISFLGFTATDDQGTSYGMGLHGSGGPGGWILRLHPDPPRGLRWLDLTTTPGEPAVRIEVPPGGRPPGPEMTVSPAAASPGDRLLDNIATRLIATVASYPREILLYEAPLQVAGLSLGLAVEGLGDVVSALRACEAIPPSSPVPGQLARLCAALRVRGHGITAPPADDMPERWRSVLLQLRHGPGPAEPAGPATAAVALPELDGIGLTLLGLHGGADGTVMYMHASGMARDDFGEYDAWPVIWVHDGGGGWHATRGGVSMDLDEEATMEVTVVPPLSRETDRIEVHAAGRSAEVRVTVPVRWR